MFLVKISLVFAVVCLVSGDDVGERRLYPLPTIYPFPCRELCRGGKVCGFGQCVCPPDHVEINEICVPGRFCKKRCPRGQVCLQGKCVCLIGYLYNGKCDKKPDPCYRIRCGKNSYCEDGKCVCSKEYVRDPKTGLCVRRCPYPKKYAGECPSACPDNCENYDDPGIRICPAVCRPEKCVCPEGYVERSHTDFTCVKKSKCRGKRDPCYRVRCGKNSYCDGGKCVCIEGYEKDPETGRCVKLDACAKIYCGPNAFCRNGKCICKEGYVEDRTGKCVKLDPCAKIYCGPNAFCRKGKCICKEGYVEDRTGKCVKLDPCAKIYCGPNSFCRKGKCICKEGYVKDRTGKCVKLCGGKICKRYQQCFYQQCVDF